MINITNLQKDLKNVLGDGWNVNIINEPHNSGFTIEVYSTVHVDNYLEENSRYAIDKVRQNIFSLKPVVASTKYFNEEIDRLKREVEELQKYKIYFELEKELRTK